MSEQQNIKTNYDSDEIKKYIEEIKKQQNTEINDNISLNYGNTSIKINGKENTNFILGATVALISTLAGVFAINHINKNK